MIIVLKKETKLTETADGVLIAQPTRVGRNDRSGSALIIVLWVIGLLALLVSSFAFDARIESRITSYYRKRLKAEYEARSGIEVAELLMLKSLKAKTTAEGDPNEGEWWFEPAKRLAQGLPIRELEKTLGEGKILLDIVPEPARRNVNTLKEDDWERLFEVSGVPQDMWAELIDAVLDWIDTDDTLRPHGAETEDYYARLESPYKAKNGPLDTVGELLLVKGFTKEIVSGGVIATNGMGGNEPVRVSGIEDMLTTYGDGKVNVNAASHRVLMTLPGVDEIVAGAIIEEREGATDVKGKKENSYFKDVNDVYGRIAGLDPKVRDYLSTDSGIYRITSTGVFGGVQKHIECIVRYTNKQLVILQWREEE